LTFEFTSDIKAVELRQLTPSEKKQLPALQVTGCGAPNTDFNGLYYSSGETPFTSMRARFFLVLSLPTLL
jgi:hypothetical protein